MKKALLIVILIVLFVLPIRFEMHYVVYYYMFLVGVSAVALFRELSGYNLKENRVRRWKVKRKKGFTQNFIIHTIYFIIHIIGIVLIGQLFGNGITPISIVAQVEVSMIVVLMIFIVLCAMLGSIVYWYENEKKFNKN